MSSTWTTKAFTKKSADIFDVDESLLDEEVVILLQGKNTFGDKIYCYIKLTVRKLKELRTALENGEKFLPSDFGTVIQAGKGAPSDEVKSEMAVTYHMFDLPAPPPPAAIAQPKVWGEE